MLEPGYPERWRRAAAAALISCLAALAGCGRGGEAVVFHAEGLPDTLSQWHVLRVHDGMVAPNDGVLPYRLNTPLFTDYAHKLRTVWLPPGTVATPRPDGGLDFPVGTILSKTFYYPRLPDEPTDSGRVLRSEGEEGQLPGGRLDLTQVRLVETRLLVHRQEGWVALPYVWNAAQTEARLQRGGDLVRLDLVDAGGAVEPAAYAVPDQNQCAGCHASDLRTRALQPLGPRLANLDGDIALADAQGGARVGNQLLAWKEHGLLAELPAPAPRLVDWQDAGEPLEARARAYLDVNCAHCHSAHGPGNTSGLWLGSEVDEPLRLGRCKLPIAAGQGTGDRLYGYVPGDPDASILSFRMESADPGVMMPELGRSVVHREGVALIRAWIAAQEGMCGNQNNQETGGGRTP